MDQLNPADEEQYLVRLLFAATTSNLRDQALRTIDPEDFASGHYGGIWETARKLQVEGKRITKRAVIAAADSPGVEQVLHRVGDGVPRAAEFPSVVAEVKRCGQLRRLMEATVRIQQRALAAEQPSQALSWAFDELNKLDTTEDEGFSHVFGDVLARFDEAMSQGLSDAKVIPTPWPEINERMAGGLRPGRMYVVGARPGEGKSIAAHQIAEHAAEQSLPAAVFSLEMDALEVVSRMVGNGAQIEMDEIMRRELSERSWRAFHAYRERAAGFPIVVNDRPDMSLGYIAAECRSYKRRMGLDVVVIDYLQLLKGERNVNREQEVAQISRSLKELARELDAAIVVPAQLNRESARRGKPAMSDLRESGAIEADADVVLLLARGVDEFGMPTGELHLNFAKNRIGRTGELTLPWRPHFSRIG